jgi:hypothetical protein
MEGFLIRFNRRSWEHWGADAGVEIEHDIIL